MKFKWGKSKKQDYVWRLFGNKMSKIRISRRKLGRYSTRAQPSPAQPSHAPTAPRPRPRPHTQSALQPSQAPTEPHGGAPTHTTIVKHKYWKRSQGGPMRTTLRDFSSSSSSSIARTPRRVATRQTDCTRAGVTTRCAVHFPMHAMHWPRDLTQPGAGPTQARHG